MARVVRASRPSGWISRKVGWSVQKLIILALLLCIDRYSTRNELGGVQKIHYIGTHTPFASTTPSNCTPTGAAAKIYSSIINGDQLTTTENLHRPLCGPAYKYPGSRCVLLYLSHDQSASTHNNTGITTVLKNMLVILKFNQSCYIICSRSKQKNRTSILQ